MEKESKVVRLLVVLIVISTLALVFSAANALQGVIQDESPVLETEFAVALISSTQVRLTGTISNYGHYGASLTVNFTITDSRGASLSTGMDLGWISPEGGTKTINKVFGWPATYESWNTGDITFTIDPVLRATRP